MSFGGGSGFGGFGSNNNQNTGFGGFGSNNNNNSSNNNNAGGFGSSTNTGFGSNSNPGGGMFGSNNTAGTTGFGGSGFGSNNNASPFGAKPAFGASTTSSGGGLFGNNTATTSNTGFGGFGSTANNNNTTTTTTGFGSSNNAPGGLFGSAQNKPAFGSNTGGSIFGGGGASTGFGSNTNTTSAFGGTSTGFGASANTQQNNGTGAVPFSAFTEKDTATNANSHYQSITFQQPYQGFSFEELRLADYNQGRRFGNSNGQAGGFGTSTGFGGFGGTNTPGATAGFGGTATTGNNVFGSSTTQSPFGQNNQQSTTGGFGSGGGLFGAQKPAGSLFGSTPASSGTTGGALFGTSGTTGGFGSGGFGSGANTGNTGTSLFGNNNNNQNQPKPAFGGFGASTTGASTGFGSATGGFGSTQTSTGGTGLFGNAGTTTTTNNPFGGNQQSSGTPNPFGGFGQNQNQGQNQTQTGSSLFGGFGNQQNQQNQQKSSLFGGSTGTGTGTGTGLFGSATNNTQTTGGSLFGGNNNQNQQKLSLFGGPTGTGTGGSLFGGANNTTNTGTSLFGNTNNNNTSTGTGLFGNLNNNNNQQQQQGSSLFGGSLNNNTATGNTGGGLFGNLGKPQATGFGTSQNQQTGNNSLFGGSQQGGQSLGTSFTASVLSGNPYGNDQLFANLTSPSAPVGPLATPLSGAQKPAKRPPMLPTFKINPSNSLRLITPQKRGYGFSYSTYGTPGSAQTFSGLGSSLLSSGGGRLGHSLGKSFSTTNLRHSFNAEESVLAPGAFTPNYSRPYSSSSIRRLKIDRTLRTDLFGTDGATEGPAAKKRVSFDAVNGTKDKQTNGDATPGPNNALVRTETDGPEPSSEELGLLRAPRPNTNGTKTNGTSDGPEMEQVRGSELAIVPENEAAPAAAPPKPSTSRSQKDQQLGEYWMIPSLQELRKMSRDQLKKVSKFTVGRMGAGKIEFSEVDLTTVPLEEIMDGLVKLKVRSATVYEDTASTPPMGKGLNVPSIITLENSWPRAAAGRLPVHERKGMRYEKHIQRLKEVEGAEFVDYIPETGEWKFRVEHFTTYGLDDGDDDDEYDDTQPENETSMLSPPPDSPTPQKQTPTVNSLEMTQTSQGDESMLSPEDSNPDDTFDFKKGPRKSLPGGFGDQSAYEDMDMEDQTDMDGEYEASEHDASDLDATRTSNLEDPFGPAPVGDSATDASEHDMQSDEEQDVTRSSPKAKAMADVVNVGSTFGASMFPRSILKASTAFGTPAKEKADFSGDWAETLQRTVSPRKQDRQTLRDRQASAMVEQEATQTNAAFQGSLAGKAFSTTMDIMNSLWGQPPKTGTKNTAGGKGFEWPYAKRPKTDDGFDNLNDADKAFHLSSKPSWTTDNTVVYTIAGNAPTMQEGSMTNSREPLVFESKDVRFAKFNTAEDVHSQTLQVQSSHTAIAMDEHRPFAQAPSDLTFAELAANAEQNTAQSRYERQVWQLASILFDSLDESCREYTQGIPSDQVAAFEHRIRRDALSAFWAELVHDSSTAHAKNARTAEEEALAHLSGNNIEEACAALVNGRDFRLATMIAQMPGDPKTAYMVKQQIESWRSQNVLSEIPEPLRALYELVAGNCCVSEGKSGASEDRAPTFGISSHFGLDWRRSFALRLWFGTQATDNLEAAVNAYSDDLASGKESVRPMPPFTKDSSAPQWDDANWDKREDVMMGLLRLYASDDIEVTETLAPAAVSGNPLNSRLAWQLVTVLLAKGILSSESMPAGSLDALTQSFASQLETAGFTLPAMRTLLHLSQAATREGYIRDLLYRRAGDFTSSTSSEPTDMATHIIEQLKVPSAWIWRASALYAHSVLQDDSLQVTYLLRAGDRQEAHDVLCRVVGPRAVIERDHDPLRELLGEFMEGISARGVKTAFSKGGNQDIRGWQTGGEVYHDYIHLLDLEGRDEGQQRDDKVAVLRRLTRSLPEVLKGRKGKVALEERVAVGEMAGLVRAEVERLSREEKIIDASRVDRLPVADDTFVRQGVDMSGAYYRAIAAQ